MSLATALEVAGETDGERLGVCLANLAKEYAGATRARFVSGAEAELAQAHRAEDSLWIPVVADEARLGVLCSSLSFGEDQSPPDSSRPSATPNTSAPPTSR